MTKKTYSPEFKVHALRQVLLRNSCTIQQIAADLNMITSTLKGWMKGQKKSKSAPKSVSSFTADERLTALHETFSSAPGYSGL